MKITGNTIQNFVSCGRRAPYSYENKESYRKMGRSILRQIAKDMGMQKGEYDIRWNPGGIAVAGDHTLHTDRIYVSFCDNCNTGWFYWRTCESRRDYTGGTNQIVMWSSLIKNGLDSLIRNLRNAQNRA